MKNKIIYIVFLLTALVGSWAQNTATNVVAQEAMYVHTNSSLLFSGEYLYYKLYCLNAQTYKKSKRSNISYVDLVDSNGKAVFNHKIILKDGLGDGDFFVPSTIPSGTYKLIAYTQWMQNNPRHKFFEAALKIVNPYIAEINNTQDIESIKLQQTASQKSQSSEIPENLNIKIVLDKQTLSTREKLKVVLQNNMGASGNGHYSMSVRKVENIETFKRKTAVQTISKKTSTKVIPQSNTNYNAETDGYIMRGQVINKASKLPAQAVDVAISIPGDNFLFTVATTNSAGEFSFEIDEDFEGTKAIFQMVEETKENFEIKLLNNGSPDYSKLDFPRFSLNESTKDEIVARSIYNQVENAYYNLKPDTIVENLPAVSFVRYEKGITYNLDDYTRFKTMKEVLTEIVRLAWTTTIDGKRIVKVLEREMTAETPYLPLLFVDGVFMENHEEFLNVDALEVQSIKVIRKGYVFGKKDYQGVVVVTTKKGDYLPNPSNRSQIQQPLFLPQPSKRYFSQSYGNEKLENNERIPDYRLQLLWNPSVRLTIREQQQTIYSSDVSGVYEVVVEGLTDKGVPVSLRETFEVYDSLGQQ